MTELDFSLGSPRTQLNFAPAVRNYFLAADRKSRQLQADEERERNERMAKIVKSSTDPRTGKTNWEAARKTAYGSGDFKAGQEFGALHASDMKHNQAQMKLAQQREAARRTEETVIADQFSRFKNDDGKIDTIIDGRLSKHYQKYGIDTRGKTKESILREFSTKISPKRFDSEMTAQDKARKLQEKETLKTLDDEFRTKVLPTIDISNLSEDQNARNQMVKQILSTPYGKTETAKAFIKSTKGKPSNVLAQMEMFKKKQDLKREIGKPFTGAQTKELNALVSSASDLTAIRNKINSIPPTHRGPLVGQFTGKNPYDKNIQELNKMIDAAIPGIARGVFGEVGVLTDLDMDRYRNMFANSKTDPKVAPGLMDILSQKLDRSYKQVLKGHIASKLDIGEWSPDENIFDVSRRMIESLKPKHGKWKKR